MRVTTKGALLAVVLAAATAACRTAGHNGRADAELAETRITVHSSSSKEIPLRDFVLIAGDESACATTLANRFMAKTLGESFSVSPVYKWRHGITDGRKFWFEVLQNGSPIGYQLNMRISLKQMEDNRTFCQLDITSINPAYVTDGDGVVHLSMKGSHSSSIAKLLEKVAVLPLVGIVYLLEKFPSSSGRPGGGSSATIGSGR